MSLAKNIFLNTTFHWSVINFIPGSFGTQSWCIHHGHYKSRKVKLSKTGTERVSWEGDCPRPRALHTRGEARKHLTYILKKTSCGPRKNRGRDETPKTQTVARSRETIVSRLNFKGNTYAWKDFTCITYLASVPLGFISFYTFRFYSLWTWSFSHVLYKIPFLQTLLLSSCFGLHALEG